MLHIQTRRVTRTTRTAGLKDENANANPRSRIVTRSKPPSSSIPITQRSIPTRLTAPSVSTRTKAVAKDAVLEDPAAQGKRKRSTLGEVTVNKPKARGATTDKGKAKEDVPVAPSVAPAPSGKFAGVVIKSKTATTTTVSQPRQALRTVAAAAPLPAPAAKRPTRSSTVVSHVLAGAKEEQKEPLHVDAMAIDPPEFDVPLPRVNGRSRNPSSLAAITRRTSAVQAVKEERERDEMEAEANRVFKKRRTSS